MPNRLTQLVLFLTLFPSALAAQSPLHMGDARVQPARLPRSTERFEMLMVRDGEERLFGTYEVVVEDRGDTILVTQRTAVPQGEILDSAWVDSRTFDPARTVSRGITGYSEVLFRGTEVTGRRIDPTGVENAISARLQEPPFPASLAQLFVRLLPLVDGLRVSVPFFQDPGGATTGLVEVEGTDPVPGEVGGLAWRVRLEVGDAKATVWIDTKTLRERRIEAAMPGGAMLITRPLVKGL